MNAQEMQRVIAEECDAIKDMLIMKNQGYGSSFASPMNIFAKGMSPDAQIRVRTDDKLARIAKGTLEANEDTVQDLIGYLILMRVLKRLNAVP